MSFHQQAHVIGHNLHRHDAPAVLASLRADQILTEGGNPARGDRPPVPRAPRDVIPGFVHPTSGHLHLRGHAGDYTHDLCQTTRFPRRLKTAVPPRGA
jgi:hypothetical protein